MRPAIYKTIISFFIVLNIAAVLICNSPTSFNSAITTSINNNFGRAVSYRFEYAAWLLRHYAGYTGLNSVWKMFGRQTRYNWWYQIKARYDDNSIELLALPLQSKRLWWQYVFIDFKEEKFHHNLYSNKEYRKRYAAYLCRKFTYREQAKIESITYELHQQRIYSASEARNLGYHIDPQSFHRILNVFPCPKPASNRGSTK